MQANEPIRRRPAEEGRSEGVEFPLAQKQRPIQNQSWEEHSLAVLQAMKS